MALIRFPLRDLSYSKSLDAGPDGRGISCVGGSGLSISARSLIISLTSSASLLTWPTQNPRAIPKAKPIAYKIILWIVESVKIVSPDMG